MNNTILIDLLPTFLVDIEEHDAFLTGSSGTGKSTLTKKLVDYLARNEITFRVTAYTHEAKDVLINKMPEHKEHISTLHNFIKKRPSLNQGASDTNNIMVSRQYDTPEMLRVLIVDEFSYVGMRDKLTIEKLQEEPTIVKCSNCAEYFDDLLDVNDYDCAECCMEGIRNTVDFVTYKERYGKDFIPLKVIYVGDPNQSKPIKDSVSITTSVLENSNYHQHLTKVWRVAEESKDLLEVVNRLKDMVVNGDTNLSWLPSALKNSPSIDIISKDEVKDVYNNAGGTKIICAYTREKVQKYNRLLGTDSLQIGSSITIPNLRIKAEVTRILLPYQVLDLNTTDPKILLNRKSKYNPIKTIDSFVVDYPSINYISIDTDEGTMSIASIFGSYEHKVLLEKLSKDLVKANKTSEDSKTPYKKLKSFNDYIYLVDYLYATTIHKTQGKEWDSVIIDYKDLKTKCTYDMVRMLFLAMGRAKKKVYLIKN